MPKDKKARRDAESCPTWEEFDAAKELEYHDSMAEYRANVAVLQDRHARAQEAQQQTLQQKVTEAEGALRRSDRGDDRQRDAGRS